jgi:CheY-like chemotaxis protein
MLEDFKAKDFVAQMGILTRLGQDKDKDTISPLFGLFHESTGDKTADTMIEHTLRDILSAHEEETVKRLAPSAGVNEKKLCLQVIRIEKFQSAVPVLIGMVSRETDMDVLTAVFLAMSEIKAPEFLDLFRAHINHSNEIIAALCIEMIGQYHDTGTFSQLEKTITEAEGEKEYEVCSVNTAWAIETMAAEANDRSLQFLVTMIHHRNPTARRIIQEELIKLGEKSLSFIAEVFSNGQPGKKIMAANVIGRIGSRKGGAILVQAMDKGQADDINVKTSIYEAFGRIQSMKGLVCLVDALDEDEAQVLITAAASLDGQLNPGVIDAFKSRMIQNQDRGRQLAEAVVSAHALNLFEALYHEGSIRFLMMGVISASNDPETLGVFTAKLEVIPGIQAAADRRTLMDHKTTRQDLHILAVDDSRPMLLFYRKIISSMDYHVTTAENGVKALEVIEVSEPFDLVITDMNMPYMDGIEFARHLRMLPDFADTPIIMGTTESDQSQIQLARNSGIDDFITKPIPVDMLKEKIESYLAKKP